MSNVYVATWSTPRSADTRVFSSREGAERWRQAIAAERWPALIDPAEAMPADPAVLAQRYFDLVEAREEAFDLVDYVVEP